MDSIVDQLCPPSNGTAALPKSRGQSDALLIAARAVAREKYTGGLAVRVSRTTVDGLRQLFGPKLKARHLRTFLDDLSTGQYKLIRVRPKPLPVVPPAAPKTDVAASAGPAWSIKQAAAEFNVTYACLLYRVQQGLIASIAHGKRRLIPNDEILRLKRVGLR